MTTTLQNVSINAYRGLSGLELEHFTPVSLIVGANNSGKSSIIEAIGLFLRPTDPTQWVNAVRHRDFDMSLIDGLRGLFAGLAPDRSGRDGGRGGGSGAGDGSGRGDGSGSGSGAGDGSGRGDGSGSGSGAGDGSGTEPMFQIDVVGEIEGTKRTVMANGLATSLFTEDGIEHSEIHIVVRVDGAPPVALRFPGPALPHHMPIHRVFTVTPATHYSTKALVEHLSRVVDEGKKRLAVEVLQIFDPDVEELDVSATLGGREAVRVTHRRRGVVDLASFGDGMRRCATLALALARASQGVLLIDEIEAGIHHSVLSSVLSKLLSAAATSQVQLIATTHSLEAVDAIVGAIEERDTPDDLSAFWVQRKAGKHEVRRYDFAKLCRLREGGLDIR